MNKLIKALLLVTAGLWLVGCKAGRDVYAVTTNDTLIKFQTDKPDNIDSEVAITGLDSGETLRQIDFRPNGGLLYGITSKARVVTVNTGSGAARLLSTTPFTTDTLSRIAFDVNPQGDYLRVVATVSPQPGTGTGTPAYFNARLDPTTGAVITVDSRTLSYQTNDKNFGETPQIAAIAHTNDRSNASSTVEYGLELTTQTLVRITTAGVLTTIGSLNHGFTENAGFDIVRDRGDRDGDAGLPYAVLSEAGGSARFYDVDLGKGGAGSDKAIGGSRQIRAVAVTLDPPKRSGFAS
ncbi:MAG: hypothetical protein NVS9B10_26870 [Nevskia sp.]